MFFALVDDELKDARELETPSLVCAECVYCGKPVELADCGRPSRRRPPKPVWVHVSTEDAVMCKGDKDEKIDILRERIWDLERHVRVLEDEKKDLWRKLHETRSEEIKQWIK